MSQPEPRNNQTKDDSDTESSHTDDTENEDPVNQHGFVSFSQPAITENMLISSQLQNTQGSSQVSVTPS